MSDSRYSYGGSFRFASHGGYFTGVLHGGQHTANGGECPWPLEYARRVYDRETSGDEDPNLVALVGPVADPVCAITVGGATGSFGVAFPEGLVPSFVYYSADVGYGHAFEDMSEEERAARVGQIFLSNASFAAVVDGREGSVVVLFRPDGLVRVVFYAGDAKPEILDWHECEGHDPEDLWLPTPAFDDYRALETREPRGLAAVRESLSERIGL